MDCDLRLRARELMLDHVYRTLLFVQAWFNDASDVAEIRDYLLENQDEIGAAFGAKFGHEAGLAVAKLFREHILGAVPLLVAVRGHNQVAQKRAMIAWRANARQLAAAAEGLDHVHFPREVVQKELYAHLDHTAAYAGAIIMRDGPGTVRNFEEARKHMVHFADLLVPGLSP